MVKYLTLDEAARILQISPDKLREMANKKQIRAFQDRGTLRFRSEDIEERARTLGLGSEPEMPIGEAPAVRPGNSPTPTKRGGKSSPRIEDSDEISLDLDLPPAKSAGPASGRSPRPAGSRSPSPAGSRSPSPRPGRSPRPAAGDSDVRLAKESVNFDIEDEGPSSSKSKGRKSESPSDSDVKIEVDDSMVSLGGTKPKTPSDSDIRLEALPSLSDSGRKGPQMVTEEIDLDAEQTRAAKQPPSSARPKPRGTGMANPPVLPTTSPFELSEPDMGLEPAPTTRTPQPPLGGDSSSDFELIPFDSDRPSGELGSGEIPLLAEDEVNLGGANLSGRKGASGINLGAPADSGISLEGGGSAELEFDSGLNFDDPAGAGEGEPDSSNEFELTLDEPAVVEQGDSSSDFELSLDEMAVVEEEEEDGSSDFELSLDEPAVAEQADSSSDFELSLDEPMEEADSSSEFELTLDANSGEAELALDESTEGSSEFELSLDPVTDMDSSEVEEKDIFEPTNFDVPALEDESGSEAVALDEGDTDLDSSDFDLAMDEEGSSESERDLVDLEEGEDADEGAATVAKPRKTKTKTKAKAADLDDEEVSEDFDIEEDEDVSPRKGGRAALDEDEDEEAEQPVAAAAAAPTPWGPLPAILLFPTVVVLFFAGLMTFELVQGMAGYNRPAKVSRPIIDFFARTFDDTLPK